MKTLIKLLSLGIIFTINACNPGQAPIDPYNFIPLEVGRSTTYNVHEENYYSGLSTPTIRDFQEKDVIASKIDKSKFLLIRYTRADSTGYWLKQKEIVLELLPDKLLTTIDNKAYLQMLYPINLSVRWDGNTYNNLEKKQYQYSDFENQVKIGSLTFSSTLKVIEDNNFDFSTPDILSLHKTIRQYALGIGIIYEEENDLEYCQEEYCIGEEIIDYGQKKTRIIIDYSSN
jgi:hypothetical protein